MTRKLSLSIFLVFVFSVGAFSQRTAPASTAELLAISERGRALYAYDEAAWHSTDAVMALKPTKGSFESYIGQKFGDKWTVVYGKLNADRDRYLVIYEATQAGSSIEFNVKKYDQPKEDKGFYFTAALALSLAKSDFGSVNRPYNAAVLPAGSGQLYVYLLPAQTEDGVFPLGADVRYLISTDGKNVVEKRQLHKSIIEFRFPKDATPDSGYHTAILDDVPEDSDVFHVLTRTPKIPEWVVTNKYVYQIKPDGSLLYLMTREAFLKIGKPSN